MSRCLLATALLALAACTPLPESYPIPEQRQHKDGPEPEPISGFISLADPRSPEYLVDGFLNASPDQTWRWATDKPTVRVRVSDNKNLRFRMNFTFPDESHSPLLPITVRFFVNDHLLDTVVYRKTGILEFRKPVPAEWIPVNTDILLRAEVSPIYVAEADKQKLSLILSEIGLEPNK